MNSVPLKAHFEDFTTLVCFGNSLYTTTVLSTAQKISNHMVAVQRLKLKRKSLLLLYSLPCCKCTLPNLIIHLGCEHRSKGNEITFVSLNTVFVEGLILVVLKGNY